MWFCHGFTSLVVTKDMLQQPTNRVVFDFSSTTGILNQFAIGSYISHYRFGDRFGA
jgi:hypothetical protein